MNNYEYTCRRCGAVSNLNNVDKSYAGTNVRVECGDCKQTDTTFIPEKKSNWWIYILAIIGVIVLIGFFSNNSLTSTGAAVIDACTPAVCDTQDTFECVGTTKTINDYSCNKGACVRRIITYNGDPDCKLKLIEQAPAKENNQQRPEEKKTTPTTSSPFNEDQFNLINEQGARATTAYNNCVLTINDRFHKVNLVRDQATLYQYDGDVKNCINEYITHAKEFIQVINNNPGQITSDSITSINTQLTTQSSNLKKVSQQYYSISSQRHYYIHGVYQTNSLIQLAQIIGETGAAVSSGNPIDTINSLQELDDWIYYNGGVIDTGW